MNIRQYVHKTYIPSHQVEINVQKPIYKKTFWGNRVVDRYEWKKEKTWVDSKLVEETRLEYLNPETLKWEAIPKVETETELERKTLNNLAGGYIYA